MATSLQNVLEIKYIIPKIIVTNGFTKKTDKLPVNEKELAMKYRKDYFKRQNGG